MRKKLFFKQIFLNVLLLAVKNIIHDSSKLLLCIFQDKITFFAFIIKFVLFGYQGKKNLVN